MADVTVKIPTIDALVKGMSDNGTMSTLLVGTGQSVVTRVKKQWLAGSGADTTVFSPGSHEYLIKKGLAGRQPVINMSLTGQLAKSFKVQKSDSKSATLGFAGNRSARKSNGIVLDSGKSTNLEVARGNVARRPNMLAVDDPGIQAFATNAFYKLFKKVMKL